MDGCKTFTIASHRGFYDYPLPPRAPFHVRISLKGVSAQEEIERLAARGPFVLPSQVHGTRVLSADRALRYPEKDRADGLLIAPGDATCGLRFGDCAPVLILSLGAEPWILALHSGFRGTLKNICASGMDLARQRFGAAALQNLYAWVGPCISGACYSRRMDDPSTAEALKVFAPEAVRVSDEFALLDLKRQIAGQLQEQGVPAERIFLESQCTCCRTDLFYSHRRSARENDPRMLLTIQTERPQKAECT
ncbi:MAG: polyphenol oxidase family protein [Pyramidobacter sp.]|uniref:polyphenol oxidase family protein n=1 Tax=Pyramidobacter sp. TaxID=1943581 RepID=UPI002A7EFCBF|nr:polyphenol oxidase family protein [Pyramidobacter sp.]MDY4032900.1 polyphenol oxidase family protein [Pyramidobacter sp.]